MVGGSTFERVRLLMENRMGSQRKVLFTGGSGLLGRCMRTLLPEALYPTSSEFNVANFPGMNEYVTDKKIDVVFHAAAATSPPKIEQDPLLALDANIIGTANVVKLCARNSWRLVYISTDYVFRGDAGNYSEDDAVLPVNRYAWSKLGGECAARLYDKSLIVRTTFGPEPFPYEKAFVDQWTSRETVSSIAAKLVPLIDSDLTGVIHVGGERRTVYDYALSAAAGKMIGQLSIQDISFPVPIDTSLDTSLYRKQFDK